MNTVVREIGASFMEGFLKQPKTEELVVLNFAAIGSALLIPGACLPIIVASSVGCNVARGVAEVFAKYGEQTKKLEKETKAFLTKLQELKAGEEKNSEELKKLKKSLQESYRITGVAARILHEGRLKVERKVAKLAPKIQKQQSTIEEVLNKVKREREVSESIRLQCELHNALSLIKAANVCDALAEALLPVQQSAKGKSIKSIV